MKLPYLEVTFREGRPLAAYYYLPREEGEGSVRSERVGAFVVDFAADGRSIGIEIPSPAELELDALNVLLARLGQEPVRRQDLAPLLAA